MSVPVTEKSSFARKLKGKQLIDEELVPKCRDSYCFLHLMKRDTKPFLYIVVLGTRALPTADSALLNVLKDRLLRRLRKETDVEWERMYVEDCMVLTETTWGKHFPSYSLRPVAP